MTGITKEQPDRLEEIKRRRNEDSAEFFHKWRLGLSSDVDWLIREVENLRAATSPGAAAFTEHFFAEKARGKPDTKDKAVEP